MLFHKTLVKSYADNYSFTMNPHHNYVHSTYIMALNKSIHKRETNGQDVNIKRLSYLNRKITNIVRFIFLTYIWVAHWDRQESHVACI